TYTGTASLAIATLTNLVPASLARLGATKTAEIFQIGSLKPGDTSVTFLGAAFTAGERNAVVFMIVSDGYTFKPDATVKTFNNATCSVSIKTSGITNGGVEFSYVFDESIAGEWFAMQLTEDGTQLIVSVNSEHQVLASVAFTVNPGAGKKRAQKEVGFVVVNGVGTFKTVSTSTASAVTPATVRNTSGSGSLVPQATAVPTQGYPAPTVVVPSSKQEVTQGYVPPDAIPPVTKAPASPAYVAPANVAQVSTKSLNILASAAYDFNVNLFVVSLLVSFII
ncbi:hypothetical protein HDU99_003813, partial [Rhizoclosmatium hyalinum]